MKNVARMLSSALVISSSQFSKLEPSEQTKALALNTKSKPVIFVPNFYTLQNKRTLVDKLLNGQDVSVELEFNEIELSSEEAEAIAKAKPVIERILAMKDSSYPWTDTSKVSSITCGKREIRNATGYTLGVVSAKKVWNRASRIWAGGEDPGGVTSVRVGYHNRRVSIENDRVILGCQHVTRPQVEFCAQHYGWEPNVA